MNEQGHSAAWVSLRREARWAGIGALFGAPIVFALFSTTLGERSELRSVNGELGIVERSGRWVQFVLDEQPPAIRYSARLGRMSLLVETLLQSEGDIACLVDEAGYAWELAIDGELFVSFEYAKARLRGDRAIGWTLGGVLLCSGGVLLWYSRRLPAGAGERSR